MSETNAIKAIDVAPRAKATNYPAPFAALMEGRSKRQLGNWFGLKNFGINLTSLAPGATSSLHHRHSVQDEFIYILEGHPVLITDAGETALEPGMIAGFPSGGTAHHLDNRGATPCLYLEIGDRTQGDQVTYPRDDLEARAKDGSWHFTHKDGTPYTSY